MRITQSTFACIAVVALAMLAVFNHLHPAALMPTVPDMHSLGALALAGITITPDNLRTLAQGFNAAFVRGFGSVAPSWMQVAMEIPSTASAENYGWMKELPGMREWIGPRVINNLETTGATLKNKHWEHTIGVNADDIEDDKLGIYAPRFSMQGEVAARHPDDLVWGLLPVGFSTKGFDGQYYFDTDHQSWGRDTKETSWSNTQGGTGKAWFLADLSRNFMKPLIFQSRKSVQFVSKTRADDTTVFMNNEYLYGCDARYNAGFGFHQLMVASKQTLDATSYEAARVQLAAQFRPDGSPLGVRATHLIVGQSMEGAALELLNAERNAAGATNVWQKTAQLIVCPWLE